MDKRQLLKSKLYWDVKFTSQYFRVDKVYMYFIYSFFLVSIVDLISTYFVTPDLSNEGNTIKIKFNLNWLGFIAWILYSTLFWLSYYFFSIKIIHKGLLSKYISFLFILLRNKKFHLAIKLFVWKIWLFLSLSYLGFVHFFSILMSKILAIIDNLLIGIFLKSFAKNGENKFEKVLDYSIFNLNFSDISFIYYSQYKVVIYEIYNDVIYVFINIVVSFIYFYLLLRNNECK